jgi:hypothetical protein
VWILGIALSLITFRLAISGKLWNWGMPGWLIWLTVLVGIWQWIWIAPLLRFARDRNRLALYNGILRGGISFSVMQLGAWLMLYVMFRKVTLQ